MFLNSLLPHFFVVAWCRVNGAPYIFLANRQPLNGIKYWHAPPHRLPTQRAPPHGRTATYPANMRCRARTYYVVAPAPQHWSRASNACPQQARPKPSSRRAPSAHADTQPHARRGMARPRPRPRPAERRASTCAVWRRHHHRANVRAGVAGWGMGGRIPGWRRRSRALAGKEKKNKSRQQAEAAAAGSACMCVSPVSDVRSPF